MEPPRHKKLSICKFKRFRCEYYLEDGKPVPMTEEYRQKIFAAVGSLIMTTAVCEIPLLAEAFGFASVELNEYLIALGLGFCVIPIVELVKFIQRKLG